MKTCSRCNVEKDESMFHADSSRKDGLFSWCMPCVSKYRTARKESINASRRAAYLSDPEKHRARSRKFHHANKHRFAEAKASYAREYRATNPEKVSACLKEWRNKYPMKAKANAKVQKAKRRASGSVEFKAGDILRIYDLQRGLCAICRHEIDTSYHADHVVPLSKGGNNSIDNLQLLCPPCNLSKASKDPFAHMQSLGFLL